MPFWSKPITPKAKNAKRPHSPVKGAVKKQRKSEPIAAIADPETEPERPTTLNWRMEPAKSFADWTIVVKSPSGTELFHVHRNMLLACEVFSKSVHQLPPGGDSTLQLPDEAARLFPDFLDYNYRIPVKIHSGNAVPLYSVSRTMGFSRLCWESRKFWETDMSLENMDYYYESALVYNEEKLLFAVKNACLENTVLLGLTEDSPVIAIGSPDLLQYMVKNAGHQYGEHLSKLVASFCSKHDVNATVFNGLTQSLGTVDFTVAPALLTAARKFRAAPSVGNFQRTCITALANNWDEIDVACPMFASMLACQSAEFIAELYKQSIMQAIIDSGNPDSSLVGSEPSDDEEDDQQDEDSPLPSNKTVSGVVPVENGVETE